MKLLQLSKILVFSVLIGFVFTSCESEYYDRYRTSKLDILPVEQATSYNGSFKFYYDVYIEDLTNVDFNFERVTSIRLINSKLYIDTPPNMESGSVWIGLDAAGRAFSVEIPILSNRPGELPYAYIDNNNVDYARFIDNMLYQLKRNGSVRLYMEGDFQDVLGRPVANMPFTVSIGNLLEVEAY